MTYEAHMHSAAYYEMLALRPPRELAQKDMIAEIERWITTIANGWPERSADQVADLEYGWVFPQAKFFSVLLPDGQKWGFRDLRLFCLDCDPVPRVCIVAVDPNGLRRIEEDFFGLLGRMEDAYYLHGEDSP